MTLFSQQLPYSATLSDGTSTHFFSNVIDHPFDPLAPGGTWGSEVAVGSGDVDWPTFLSIVPEDADLVLEREGGDERVADIRRAHQVVLDAT